MKKAFKALAMITPTLLLVVAGCGTSGGNQSPSGDSSDSSGTSATNVNYPTKTITIVVPDQPGGSMDTSARILAQYLPKYLPKPVSVVVQNKPGGNDAIGINAVNNARPDGYTLGAFPMPGVLSGPLTGQGNYDLTKFDWLGEQFNQEYVMVVSKKSGINSLSDIKKKGSISMAESGPTTSPGIAAIETSKALGVKLNFVPDGGSAPSLLAVSQGSVDATIFPYAAEKQEIKSGMVKPIAVLSSHRLSVLPNTPTVKEEGYPNLVDIQSTRGDIATTPGTPQAVVNILRTSIKKATNDPNYIAKMKAANLTPVFTDGSSLQTLVNKEAQAMQSYVPDLKKFTGQ
ncbi:tripartite tricarboxylate transporter substrate binding protein [Alicyclobacillus suci]|uniref:tripartite tricarboxylate transporter substrate binding protein n=1 Tax=Alicyclobacillus suci TaxID=2816080 RepID=UPI001A8C7614|nr:tripartite tricarboxylate transporter substrate binding protein [Alicyclobacillus suci]